MRVILMLAAAFSTISINADQISDDLLALGYIEKDIPSIESEALSLAKNNALSIYVDIGDPIDIRKATREEVNSSQVIFDAGLFSYIGMDKGEFGGGLYISQAESDNNPIFKKSFGAPFFNSNGENLVPIFNGNIKALIPVEEDLYIISGLAHMGHNRGAIHAIRNYKAPTAPIQVTLLPDAPEAITIEKNIKGSDTFIIAGHSSLVRFSPDDELKVMAFDSFWSGLYPSSVVGYKKSYIIGIRSGLAVVTPTYNNSNVRYFVQN